jgi:hypothetical protein
MDFQNSSILEVAFIEQNLQIDRFITAKEYYDIGKFQRACLASFFILYEKY